jgi:hypothetical protein
MRDLVADWRRWSTAERIAAIVLLIALIAAVPVLANAGAVLR